MSDSTDASSVLIKGPWEHRMVASNGLRMHIAEAGDGPLVVLLHGFPEFWWAWRHQIPALAEQGYRVCAVDMRGFGASDKPPNPAHTPTSIADDIAALVRSLGQQGAAIAGHGLGGWCAWTMATRHPGLVTGLATIGMPHPWEMRKASWRHPLQWRANSWIRAMNVPLTPTRELADSARGMVSEHLRRYSGPDRSWLTDEVVDRYSKAMALPFTPQAAVAFHTWIFRSQFNPSEIGPHRQGVSPVEVPALLIRGEHDRTSLPQLTDLSLPYLHGPSGAVTIPGVGHYPHEEAPEATTEALVDWLSQIAR